MADSPEKGSSGVLSLSLAVDGKPLDPGIGVISVRVQKRANRIASATVELLDDDVAISDFPLSSSDTFKPGAKLEVQAGWGGKTETIFVGIVVRHGVRVSPSRGGRLVIECHDAAAALTVGRKNARYEKKTDSDILKQLLSNAGLDADLDTTDVTHPELVQYYCTDWDFLLSRAEANGLLVFVEDGKVSAKAPDAGAKPVLTVTYGQDLIAFEADVDARTQLAEVEAVSWDESQQAVVTSQQRSPLSLEQGDLESSELAKVLGLDSFRLQTAARNDEASLKAWAQGRWARADLARIQGRVRFKGSAAATLGSALELAGVGKRFEGSVLAAAVRHDIEGGNWTTEVEFGLASEGTAEQRSRQAPPAGGLAPGIAGLQIGVVSKLEDADGEHRIQVTVPLLVPSGQTEGEKVWARLVQFYASDGVGAFFYPEVGDEVVLGFLDDDPADPIVLGSLYSSKRATPCELADGDENNLKALVTRSKLKIEFDEDKKVITIATPGANTITLDDDQKSIVAEDQNGNKVELNPDGITVSSPKDISVSAGGKVTIAATADAKITGLNVNAEADIGLVTKGGASAELSAGGSTTVKGAMVMIN